jgi:hypothetical protein
LITRVAVVEDGLALSEKVRTVRYQQSVGRVGRGTVTRGDSTP